MMSERDIVLDCARKFDPSIVLKTKQIECLTHILAGRDVIVNLPVGYGKSLIYQILPWIFEEKGATKATVLVISPLNIIQDEQISKLKRHSISACRLPLVTDNDSLDVTDIISGKYSILFAHPEAVLNTPLGRSLLESISFNELVTAIVIDECHIVEEWGAEFRKAYNKLRTLPAVFEGVPILALSGTLTKDQLQTLPTTLGLQNPVVIQETPNRENIFLSAFCKVKSSDIYEVYEDIFKTECKSLHENPKNYPVTLMFMPLHYISQASAYLRHLFGPGDISQSCYSVLFSRQQKDVIKKTIEDLHKTEPRLRLILTSSVAGMGFDPPSISRVIHAKPPRNLSQYLQEIGRAGRRGQASEAILYFNRRDVAKNLPGIEKDIIDYCLKDGQCLRKKLLEPFGYSKPDNTPNDKCCSSCSKQDTHVSCTQIVSEMHNLEI